MKPEELKRFIDNGLFATGNGIHTVYENAVCFFPLSYNDACLVKRPYGTFHFREVDSFKKSTDNTTHKYMSENTLLEQVSYNIK